MAGSNPSSDLDPHGSTGGLLRLWPLRVLVVSADEHFRTVTSMLTARRGCAVFSSGEADRLVELILAERIDVVVVDGDVEWAEVCAASAGAAGFAPAAGVVAVAEEADTRRGGALELAKWGPFEQLYAQIERADMSRAALRGADSAIWPPASSRERDSG